MGDISHTVYVQYKSGGTPWQRKLYAKSDAHARARLLDFITEEKIRPDDFSACTVNGPNHSQYKLNYRGDKI
jgi:hypothetical protein